MPSHARSRFKSEGLITKFLPTLHKGINWSAFDDYTAVSHFHTHFSVCNKYTFLSHGEILYLKNTQLFS